MILTFKTYLIVCPFVFLAGLVDAIGGGGGLISLPAYLIAGLPPHCATATNKLSAACGTALATFRFARKRLIDWPAAAACNMLGSYIGSGLAIHSGAKITRPIILLVLALLLLKVLGVFDMIAI